ncbi:MAG: hypothetical protein ABMA14_13960 [Hyphomonadaceae bacterium]
MTCLISGAGATGNSRATLPFAVRLVRMVWAGQLPEPTGNIPPAEAEAAFVASLEEAAIVT